MNRLFCAIMLAVSVLFLCGYVKIHDLELENARLNERVTELETQKAEIRNELTEEELEYIRLSCLYCREIVNRASAYKEIDALEQKLEEVQDLEVNTDILYSIDELELLAKCVSAEAGSMNYESQKGIAQVILNRVNSPLFPNSIEEVIYQEDQFHVVDNGAINKSVSDETFNNVLYVVLYGYDFPDNVLYFHAERTGSSNAYKCIEGTAFFKG